MLASMATSRTARQVSSLRPNLRLAGPAVIAAAALLLVAGCGSLSSRAAQGTRPPAAAPASVSAARARAASGRPADPRATAATLARRLLTALRLPAGSRGIAVPARPNPDLPATGPYGPGIVSITRLYRLTVPMSAACAWLRAQRPAGAAVAGHGPFAQRGRVVSEMVSFAIRPLPSWLYSERLYTAVTPAHGGSLLRAQAQVQWYPARSPADHIDPARYASVTVSRSARHHTTTRTLSGAGLRKLAAEVNALHAMPDIAIATPATGPGIATYRLTFNPAGGAPTIVITPFNYLFVGVTINGAKGQPLFPASTLIAAARRIMTAQPGAG